MAGVRRVIVGASAAPGSIPALRYAENLARREGALLVTLHAWAPPGGELADRRQPSACLRRVWAQAACCCLPMPSTPPGAASPMGWSSTRSWCAASPARHWRRGGGGTCWSWARARAVAGRRRHGKVSRYCVAHAQCPVIAVPPPDLARAAGHRPRLWPLRRGELTVDRALSELGGEKSGRNPSAGNLR